MHEFAVMLKSYLPDLPYAARFLDSWIKFDTDSIPVYLVVPDSDIEAFAEIVAGRAEIIGESRFAEHLVDYPIHGNDAGYMNQQIIKLAFGELHLARFYFCADSELEMLRPFGVQDFFAEPGVPYHFLTEDSELRVEPEYFATYWKPREAKLQELRRFLDLPREPLLTCHGLALFSDDALQSLRDFLNSAGLTYASALELCPYEFSWYNFWLERSQAIRVAQREPIVKVFHSKSQHLEYVLKGTTTQDLARGYVGVLVNGGYSRQFGVIDFDQPRYEVIGHYVRVGILFRALVLRWLHRAPRLHRFIRDTGRGSKKLK
jgi:hypothetical protein